METKNQITIFSILRSSTINLLLPFLNGVFLGFGEIFAHEVAHLFGWRGVTLRPASRMMAPGLGVRAERVGETEREMRDLTSLE